MRTENQVAVGSRYLMLATRMSPQRFEIEKSAALDWCSAHSDRLGASNEAALADLRTFELGENSCAFILHSCYADIPAGRSYNAVFKLADAKIGGHTLARLRFAIFRRCLPMQSLEDGHHHLAVFDFPEGIPQLVLSLPVDLFDGGISHPTLGLCDAPTWEENGMRGRDANPSIEPCRVGTPLCPPQ